MHFVRRQLPARRHRRVVLTSLAALAFAALPVPTLSAVERPGWSAAIQQQKHADPMESVRHCQQQPQSQTRVVTNVRRANPAAARSAVRLPVAAAAPQAVDRSTVHVVRKVHSAVPLAHALRIHAQRLVRRVQLQAQSVAAQPLLISAARLPRAFAAVPLVHAAQQAQRAPQVVADAERHVDLTAPMKSFQ